ncbi:MAG TPA: hypothetical protein VFK96_05565, partial [Gammaproteobacteria bacterium]|nr:hypothetical protein [Gammaproteobacteria bacterium]
RHLPANYRAFRRPWREVDLNRGVTARLGQALHQPWHLFQWDYAREASLLLRQTLRINPFRQRLAHNRAILRVPDHPVKEQSQSRI